MFWSHRADALYQGTTLEAAEKPEFFEGDGLQPVRNYFEMNVASATEGTTLSKQRLFRNLCSRALRPELVLTQTLKALILLAWNGPTKRLRKKPDRVCAGDKSPAYPKTEFFRSL